jgi:hypothetical protein
MGDLPRWLNVAFCVSAASTLIRPVGAWRDRMSTLAVRFLARWLKNSFRLATGQPPIISFRENFFRLTLLRGFGFNVQALLTCRGFTSEGVGSQVLFIMQAMAFARMTGMKYVHTPFVHLAHANRPTDWEQHFNLGRDELAAADDWRVIDYALNFRRLHRRFGVTLRETQREVARLLPVLKERYWRDRITNSRRLQICVHVRRGDVSKHHPHMWTPTASIERTISALKAVLTAQGLEHDLTIFSQLGGEDLASLGRLEIDGNPVSASAQMVAADILVSGKSCFSYVAGLLSAGVVLAPDWGPVWFDSVELQTGPPALPNWIIVDKQGRFDTDLLELNLKKRATRLLQ